MVFQVVGERKKEGKLERAGEGVCTRLIAGNHGTVNPALYQAIYFLPACIGNPAF